jgi:hypothetical protein
MEAQGVDRAMAMLSNLGLLNFQEPVRPEHRSEIEFQQDQ